MALASGVLLGLVGLAGCADIGTPPFRYQPPPSVSGADREYCHGVARSAAETTYAHYAAMMGTDPLGRRAGDRFGGSALAESRETTRLNACIFAVHGARHGGTHDISWARCRTGDPFRGGLAPGQKKVCLWPRRGDSG